MMDWEFEQLFSERMSLLRCPWCSNPESQRMNPEPMLDAVTKAPGTTGQEKTVDEIIDEVMKDIDFYEESGGGMTLSGGEIFAQFRICKSTTESSLKREVFILPSRQLLLWNTKNLLT